MFDSNFTFSASRSSDTEVSTPGYSPCSSPAPFAAAHFSISDLADQLAGHRIEREAQICYDSCQTYSNHISNDEDEMNWLIPPLEECQSTALRRAQTCPLPQRPHSPSRRTQRQANARLLCSASHREEIAALMERMVNSEEQCLISPSSAPLTPPLQDDEGYNTGDDSISETISRSSSIVVVPTRADRRRASDLVAGGACVSKSIRLRKGRHLKRVRTTEISE